jgi:MYXO-CTERM domain-containing protein
MSNPYQRHLGLATVLAASSVIGLAFLLTDDAMAGPGDVSGMSGMPLQNTDDEPFPVTRLSVTLDPEDSIPGGIIDGGGPPPTPTGVPGYIFVNMDGANLVCGNGDNATTNSSAIACQYNFTGNYPSYGGTDAQRQSVIDAVEQDWAPFNVVITTTRPNAGPYTMCMTGPANHPFGNGVLGIAPLDCFNQNMPSNIVFAFHSANQLGGQLGANTQATTISQEVAHAYGLEHVASSSDIMNPYNQGGNPAFTDSCIGLVGNGQPIQCGAQHQQYCPGGQQNSYQELIGLWGASNPDDTPPNVVVSYPYNGDVLEIGADFTITCEANDNETVASVQLWIDGMQMGATKSDAPYAWQVNDIPEGQYDIYCVATDEWDNTAMSPVITISVEPEGMPGDGGADSGGEESGEDSGADSGEDSGADSGDDSGGDGSGTDSGGSGGDGGSGGTEGGLDAGGLPPGFGLDETDGCACSSDDPRPAAGWMLLTLLVLPLARRRAHA